MFLDVTPLLVQPIRLRTRRVDLFRTGTPQQHGEAALGLNQLVFGRGCPFFCVFVFISGPKILFK